MVAIPEEVDTLAGRQHGLLTRRQALRAWPATTVDRLRHTGLLIDVAPAVYLLAGSPRSWRQRGLAACLAVGPPVALSGLAAAHLHRIDGVRRPPLQVTVPPDRHLSSPVAHVVRRVLPATDIGIVEGIPATLPARTLIDLSLVMDPVELQRSADDLVRRRLLRPGELRRRLGRPLPRCDRAALGAVADRLDGRGVGASAREDWVVDTLVAAGLPSPTRNVHMEIGGRTREIDAVYPDWKVALEYDGWGFHRDRTHFDDDREKAALLQTQGWIVLQVTAGWTGEQLVERVRAAIATQVVRIGR